MTNPQQYPELDLESGLRELVEYTVLLPAMVLDLPE